MIKYFCIGKYASREKIELIKEAICSVRPKVLFSRIKIVDKLVPKRCSEEFAYKNKRVKIKGIAGGHFILQSKPE
jgi:hypothetical protein